MPPRQKKPTHSVETTSAGEAAMTTRVDSSVKSNQTLTADSQQLQQQRQQGQRGVPEDASATAAAHALSSIWSSMPVHTQGADPMTQLLQAIEMQPHGGSDGSGTVERNQNENSDEDTETDGDEVDADADADANADEVRPMTSSTTATTTASNMAGLSDASLSGGFGAVHRFDSVPSRDGMSSPDPFYSGLYRQQEGSAEHQATAAADGDGDGDANRHIEATAARTVPPATPMQPIANFPLDVFNHQAFHTTPMARSPQMAQRTEYMKQFWKSTANEMKLPVKSYRDQLLPMARVKKVMKADSEVKMISGEVPVIFAKACEIFIQELTSLSWMSAEDNKRRTLQRFDVYYATKVSDQYDFLIDIVPPDESYFNQATFTPAAGTTSANLGSMVAGNGGNIDGNTAPGTPLATATVAAIAISRSSEEPLATPQAIRPAKPARKKSTTAARNINLPDVDTSVGSADSSLPAPFPRGRGRPRRNKQSEQQQQQQQQQQHYQNIPAQHTTSAESQLTAVATSPHTASLIAAAAAATLSTSSQSPANMPATATVTPIVDALALSAAPMYLSTAAVTSGAVASGAGAGRGASAIASPYQFPYTASTASSHETAASALSSGLNPYMSLGMQPRNASNSPFDAINVAAAVIGATSNPHTRAGSISAYPNFGSQLIYGTGNHAPSPLSNQHNQQQSDLVSAVAAAAAATFIKQEPPSSPTD